MRPYDQLAPYFGAVFPCTEEHRACYDRELPEPAGRRALDVGYGTGEHLAYLAGRGADIYGLEIEPGLVEWARRRFPDKADHFRQGGMTSAASAFQGMRFDLALLVGNTLPHAEGPREAAQTFRQMAALVADDGCLIVSTVNYDRVLAKQIAALPLLRGRTADGRPWEFHRRYDLAESPRRIMFHTRLVTDEETIEGAHALYPICRVEVERSARAAFGDVRVFGGYLEEPWSEETFGTVLIARRPRERPVG
jgi:SAM-dependent methyltransferase